MKNTLLIALVAIFLFCFSATSANGQIVRDSRRAISLGTCIDASALPQDVKDQLANAQLEEYVDRSSLNGMSQTTVRGAGWSTIGVWNERPANDRRGTQFCFSMLDPKATVWTLNGDKTPMVGYLDNCLKDGKRTFKNRIIVPPPTVITNTVEKIVEKPVDRIVYQDKIVDKIVKEECPDCPEDASLSEFASGKSRLTGGLKGTLVSAGAGCAIAGLIGKSLEDCLLYGALPSAVASRAAQAVNPSPDSIRARCNGEIKTFKKGKEGTVGDCELIWEGNTAVLKFQEQECKSRTLSKNLNLTVIAVGRRDRKATTTPIKNQPVGSIPIRPNGTAGVGNQIPGGGVPISNAPGTTVPTRPMRTVTIGGVTKLVPQ